MASKRPVNPLGGPEGAAQSRERAQAAALVRTLSPREREVLALMVTGATARAIGNELGIAEATVKTHLTSLYRKLRVANRVQATRTYLLGHDQRHGGPAGPERL